MKSNITCHYSGLAKRQMRMTMGLDGKMLMTIDATVTVVKCIS